MIARHEFLKEVRGKGLMIGVEFGSPNALKLKAAWKFVEAASKGFVLPANHRPFVQGAQDSDASSRPRQPYGKTVAATGDIQ